MIIGIDISQIVYEGTGVGRYVHQMVKEVITRDEKNRYILFGASLRKQTVLHRFYSSLPNEIRGRVALKIIYVPPKILDVLWNILHILPIEWIIGHVDVFWSSDWTQPPLSQAKGITIIHDLTIYRFPESFPEEIVAVHKRKLKQSIKECTAFLCDSEATKMDAHTFLKIPTEKLFVVYPGYTL